jgi:hypothetical protein
MSRDNVQLSSRVRFLSVLVLAGCAPEVIVLDGDGASGSGGASTLPPAVATGAQCPQITEGFHCPADCDAIFKRVGPDADNYCTFPCDRDTPTGCRPGEECIDGKCMPGPCDFTFLCPPGFGCLVPDFCAPMNLPDQYHCQFHPQTGAACDGDCDAQVELEGTSYCTALCSDYPCAVGFGCATLSERRVCVPMCFVDDDCPPGLRCGASGLCDTAT